MRLALDAMGGDYAPGPIVAGALHAVQSVEDLSVILVGVQDEVEKALQEAGGPHERLEIFHAPEVVGMEESPTTAMKRKPDNSILKSWQLLKEEKVDGIVSAGNTGAIVAASFYARRFLKGVKRPGIAAIMPTLKGASVMIDVGANVNPKAIHLYQYGVMGDIFAKYVLKKPTPTIGLLNVGTEEQKGHGLAKETHALFNSSILKDQFIGNIEGRDVNKGVADVIVCDGFVGNIVLKTCEGVFDFSMKMVAKTVLPELGADQEKGQQAFKALVQRYDYSESGGAPLLGIDGICLICHGSSGDVAIKNALSVAAKYVRMGLNQLIVQELQEAPAEATEDSE